MGRRELPHARRARPPRDRGQVERRLRRDGHADAPARTCSAASRRTPATRCSRSATSRSSATSRARSATTTTARTTRFWEDFRSPPGLLEAERLRACSTRGAWPPATRPTRTARSAAVRPGDRASSIPEVWERWLAWDPVRMVAGATRDALRSMRAIYIDAGKRDEFYLDLGAEAFRRELEADRRHRRLLRAVRRDAHGDRVPLPARAEIPGRAPQLTRDQAPRRRRPDRRDRALRAFVDRPTRAAYAFARVRALDPDGPALPDRGRPRLDRGSGRRRLRHHQPAAAPLEFLLGPGNGFRSRATHPSGLLRGQARGDVHRGFPRSSTRPNCSRGAQAPPPRRRGGGAGGTCRALASGWRRAVRGRRDDPRSQGRKALHRRSAERAAYGRGAASARDRATGDPARPRSGAGLRPAPGGGDRGPGCVADPLPRPRHLVGGLDPVPLRGEHDLRDAPPRLRARTGDLDGHVGDEPGRTDRARARRSTTRS